MVAVRIKRPWTSRDIDPPRMRVAVARLFSSLFLTHVFDAFRVWSVSHFSVILLFALFD
jgi:hypothetical protein